jgi:2-dehydro-3-deoxyphosphogluconate aldolase/(4S)-4-hydroxy-2-oxoglutarate aldolase
VVTANPGDFPPASVADTQLWFDHALTASPVLAILRGFGPARSLDLAQRAWDLGIHLVEIPLQADDDLAALRQVSAAAAERGHPVGAGTVTSREQITAARAAGASFAVSPGLDPAVVTCCIEHGLAALPGVATASEIQQAAGMGLRWLKAFPAAALGTGWFRAMRGPFPAISMVATGGIDASNAAEFFAAGASAVAVGSALDDPRQLERLTDLVYSQPSRGQHGRPPAPPARNPSPTQ